MVKLTGKFKRKSAENYDEFLAKVGVGFMLRKAATASTPTMAISVKPNLHDYPEETTL